MKEFQNSPVNVPKKVLMGIVAIAALFITLFVLSGIMEDCDKSKNYVCQYPITGTYAVWTEGGAHGQWWGNVYEYSKTTQVEFTGVEKNDEGYIAAGPNPGAAVTFNDRGRGFIIGSLRVVLPRDFEHMAKIQQDFGSEEALISTLIKPTLYKVVTSCGPLMSSLESVSETRTDLIQYITEQLNDGVFKTKINKIKVTNELTGDTETVAKAEILVDKMVTTCDRRSHLSSSMVSLVTSYRSLISSTIRLRRIRLMLRNRLTLPLLLPRPSPLRLFRRPC